MKPRTLLVLLAAVLVLGAFIGLYERKLPSTEERLKQGDRILDVDKEAVTAVDVEREGQPALHLERVIPAIQPPKPPKAETKSDGTPGEPAAPPAEWRLALPVPGTAGPSRFARADSTLVANLVEALTGLARTRTLESPDPKSVGLDSPRATVRLKTAKGESVLRFGAKVPTGAEVLVGMAGSKDVYVASDAILQSFERAPGDWRDRQMFFADREAIERVRLTPAGGGVGTVLARKGEGFEIVLPEAAKDRADHDLVEALLTGLTGLRAQAFIDDPQATPASLGLAPAQGVAEVTLKSGQAVLIELGAPAPASPPPAPPAPPAPDTPPEPPAAAGLYVRTGGPAGAVFSAQTSLAADVARGAADWRSRALTAFQVFEVESVQATDAAGSLSVERAGTDWKRGKDTISYTPVSDLLFAVTGGKASGLLAATAATGKAGLGTPLVTLTLKAEKGGAETLTFYPPTPQGAPVQVSGRTAVLLLPADRLAEVQKQLAAIRGAQPIAPATAGEDGKEPAKAKKK